MATNLKPYGEYKETEYDWLGEVPKHWKRVAVRSITKLSNERNGTRDDLELLSVYREYGVIRKSSRDDNHNVESQNLSNYKFVDKGYLVLNKMKMWQGSLGVSQYKGIVSPAYIVCKLVGELNFKYVHYLFRSPQFKTIYNRISYGVRVGQWDMRYDDFKNIKLYFPPFDEQNQIVKYLDSQLAKINKFIRNKKKLIELIKEQQRVMINQVVTKGIDLSAKMQHSSFEWLGDIPEGWNCQKFSIVAKVKSNLVHPSDYLSYTQVSPENIEKNSGKLLECKTVLESGVISNNHIFYKGQILYSKVRPKLNKVTIAPFDGLCSADMYPIETSLNSKYLLNYMLSDIFLMQLSVTDNRVKMPKINKEELSSIIIVVPPKDIQLEIVRYIEEKNEIIDYSINYLEKEISLMTEYRTRLISDVVTGKVDVRGIEVDEILKDDIEIGEEELDEKDEVVNSEEFEV